MEDRSNQQFLMIVLRKVWFCRQIQIVYEKSYTVMGSRVSFHEVVASRKSYHVYCITMLKPYVAMVFEAIYSRKLFREMSPRSLLCMSVTLLLWAS